jgi:hypothetical protein
MTVKALNTRIPFMKGEIRMDINMEFGPVLPSKNYISRGTNGKIDNRHQY